MKGQVLLERGADGALLREEDGKLWLASRHASGWIRLPTGHASDWQALASRYQHHMQSGFVAADAALLAVGESGSGEFTPPTLSWGDREDQAIRGRMPEPGLYAIVDTVARLRAVVEAGVSSVQLRIKTPPDADRGWFGGLGRSLREATSAARDAGATLVVNDHWRLAAELGAPAVHLGQEDIGRLGAGELAELAAAGIALGVSSHSVWELCRARSLQPAYIACGPVWPTTTKDMPWRPQGLDNLSWWCAHAGSPVTAIGGILTPDQVRRAARAGAAGVCVLRGLGEDPRRTVPALQEALAQGRAEHRAGDAPQWPHPTLEASA